MIPMLMTLMTSSAGKWLGVVALVIAVAAGGYGVVKLHDGRVLADQRAAQVAADYAAAQATYERNLAALQHEADAAKARATALGAVHQRIANATPTDCTAAPDAVRAAILRTDTSGQPAGTKSP